MNHKQEKEIIGRLMDLFHHRPGEIFKARALYRTLKLNSQAYPAFKQLLRDLAESGLISRYKGNQYGLLRKRELFEGILHVKTQGYGFLVRDDEDEDIFISQRNMGSAQHKDRVSVELWSKPVGKLAEGKVVEILERGRERIVGLFQKSGTFQTVLPDELKMSRDILIPKGKHKNAQDGQKVVVEIDYWGDARRMPEGRVTEVLGFPHDPHVDLLSIIYSFNLPTTFPKAVEAESQTLSSKIPDSEIKRRKDFRNKCVFTIDPEDAKDFDDAVSLEKLDNGNWQLGVHIADVSYFVTPNSKIDLEAVARTTSIYLVDRVLPMLPKRLSNQLCSLRPHEDHLTFSVLMELTPKGHVAKYQICESVINSKFRLTYEDVHEVIIGNSEFIQKFCDIHQTLLDMHGLSKILFESWRKAGSIDFHVPEAEVELDADGIPVRLGVRKRLESHRLIESFMLLANRVVATHIQTLRENTMQKFRFLYRVHEKPSGKKLDNFMRFIHAMGYPFDPGKKLTSKKFQTFLDSVKNTPQGTVIETVALRAMMKATYTTANVGHFGLAFPHYTHFTSPIRRYPDLIVHRLLKAYQESPPERVTFPMALSKLCTHATEREILADEAERESIKAKQISYMENHIGEVFDAVISGVTGFGFFAEIPELLVEGLVHVNELQDDYYIFDEDRLRLTGDRTGRIFQIGGEVRVQVVNVLHEMRKIDFILAE